MLADKKSEHFDIVQLPLSERDWRAIAKQSTSSSSDESASWVRFVLRQQAIKEMPRDRT